MSHRVVIAAGGSGGHLFPAMHLAQALQERLSDLTLLFMGSGLSHSPYFSRHQFEYADIHSAPWRGVRPRALWQLGYRNSYGVLQAWRQLKRFAPTAIIGFGSYHTLPVMVAALGLRQRLFLYEANTIPGKVNAFFSPYAALTAIQFPCAAEHLRGPVRTVAVSGRCRIDPHRSERAAALQHYGLDPHKPTVLIAGGSQGALAVNTLALAALTPSPCPLQIIHLAGHQAPCGEYQAAYQKHGLNARVLPFEENMVYAWAAADLFIGRAGAATLAELLQARMPALLIPYPWASEQHQEHNARFFSQTVGGGKMLLQHPTTPADLHQAIAAALAQQGTQCRQWSDAINTYMKANPLPPLEEVFSEYLTE